MSTADFVVRDAVAASTLAAAHKRDHDHAASDAGDCVPHCTEVVRLGGRAAMVCHDCGTDTGFVETRAAEVLCRTHRLETAS